LSPDLDTIDAEYFERVFEISGVLWLWCDCLKVNHGCAHSKHLTLNNHRQTSIKVSTTAPNPFLSRHLPESLQR
jgi:hypothetical protein